MIDHTPLFDSFVCQDDTIEFNHNGREYRAFLKLDTGCNPDEFDCYSAVDKQAWLDDEWQYFGVVVEPKCECCGEWKTHEARSLWGIEGNMPGHEFACALHMTRTAFELADEE